jgi:type I restriction enzyme, S subunit
MTQTVLLGDIGRVVTGKTPPKANPEFWGDELDFITPTDFGDSKYISPARKLSGAGEQAMQRLVCPANSVIVTCIGSDMGKVALAGKPFVSNQQINTLVVDEEKMDPNFIYYLLKFNRPLLRKYAESGGSTMPIINKSTFERLSFNIPDLETQKKIADILGTIDEKIELNRKMNETLEQIGQALFKHYFINNPEADDWDEKSLDEIADFLNGVAMQKFPDDGGPTLPVIKIREMSGGITNNTDIGSANIPEKYIVHNGDILFSWSGTLIVKPWCDGEGALNQHLFKVTSHEYPKWFYYYWTKHHLQSFIETAAGKATTMGHIQRQHLTDAKVKVPSEDQLAEITQVMKPILDKQITNELEARKLAKSRDSLLPRLISGKIII